MFLNYAHWGSTHSLPPLFEEADGADEILVHSHVGGNGSAVKIKSLLFLPPSYVYSFLFGGSMGNCVSQCQSKR